MAFPEVWTRKETYTIILCFLLPCLAVWMKENWKCSMTTIIAVFMTIFFWVPGILFAIYICFCAEDQLDYLDVLASTNEEKKSDSNRRSDQVELQKVADNVVETRQDNEFQEVELKQNNEFKEFKQDKPKSQPPSAA